VPLRQLIAFFAQEIARRDITVTDASGFSARWAEPTSAAEITERAGHILAEVSNGLGIIVSPPY